MDVTRKVPMGRPRGFDTDAALHRAMLLFWERGYEGASLTDLTTTMGITKTSMYAAFGNKDDLFRKALQRYTEGPAAYVACALAKDTAREVAEAFLAGSVQASTLLGCPAGCLGVQGSLAAGESGRVARDILAAWRDEGRAYLHTRFRQAADDGDLPPDTDPAVLARYVMTVANGIAVQAAGGATREDLQQVAEFAMKSWPT
ncbi:TetR/AcrR family transcriptional regulator [Actinoplanes couchii]|uniref:TetR family transcriptional regulator n=1 Tax=Actinoplanes couchii TaxID=403638 RepID=A0ABQ3XDW0_9ACTN|nr:TetR/AcrR family transcriptional regulator [Actinoplanes couchii]MDR6317179.1 AcrR family transcriptional regulator [Actinoplanes couchii]GID56674.1 TetR family transcriptional regulator [Actinoplanes couchii]